jgi:hypothetical protein
MTHYSRLSKIVIDVPPAEHDRELAFCLLCGRLPGMVTIGMYRVPGRRAKRR